jgi:hypothetical protein
MIWWNIKLLKQRLINEGLSQKHLFVYIFIFIMLSEFLLQAAFYIPIEGLNIYDYAEFIAEFITIGLGTYLIYRVNGGSEGKQFAERFFSISFVVGMRFFVLSIPIFLIYLVYIVGQNEGEDGELPTTLYESAIFTCWLIAFYWRVIVHVKDVANSTPE